LTVSGLIIDAFGELRDQFDSVNCKDYFDTVPHGFDTHRKGTQSSQLHVSTIHNT
jgi:hypothetical protein